MPRGAATREGVATYEGGVVSTYGGGVVSTYGGGVVATYGGRCFVSFTAFTPG